MELGTGTKKRSLFRFLRRREPPEVLYPEAEDLIRQRWRYSSDKVSSLTVRIMAVNIIAIMILGLGILYLGQYTDSLIEGELESLRSEARFFAGAVSEGAVRPVFQAVPVPFQDPRETEAVSPELVRRMVRRQGEIGGSRIRLFGTDGSVLADSHQLIGPGGVVQVENLTPVTQPLTLDSLFAQSATRFLDLIPVQMKLPQLPQESFGDVYTFPDTQSALGGAVSATAWRKADGRIVLTAAAPVQKIKQVLGVALVIRDGTDVEKAIAEVRVDVFRVFLGALGVTVMLSIYLSGLISRPLQRLAAAAEAVRLGKGRHVEMPDMSARGDEIGELSLVLRDMTQALWDRMDTIERFAADVAHEIKNPLTSLRSAVETAARVKDDESRRKLMDIIHHDVQRLDRLISDISSASRLDAELSREEAGTVDLRGLLHRLRDAYKQPLRRAPGQADDSDAEETNIVLDLPGGMDLVVQGNEERLNQVFGNLVSNALSFSPEGGFVSVRVLPRGEYMLVQVDDQGAGIPEAKLDTIFERFYTERPAHEDYGSHSGLGLSICRQIVAAHDGRIWAENLTGSDGGVCGARFSVLLPTV